MSILGAVWKRIETERLIHLSDNELEALIARDNKYVRFVAEYDARVNAAKLSGTTPPAPQPDIERMRFIQQTANQLLVDRRTERGEAALSDLAAPKRIVDKTAPTLVLKA
ncbi:MAG: hypothetical protein AAF569_07220 [Pseudomonadota bacterium]